MRPRQETETTRTRTVIVVTESRQCLKVDKPLFQMVRQLADGCLRLAIHVTANDDVVTELFQPLQDETHPVHVIAVLGPLDLPSARVVNVSDDASTKTGLVRADVDDVEEDGFPFRLLRLLRFHARSPA